MRFVSFITPLVVPHLMYILSRYICPLHGIDWLGFYCLNMTKKSTYLHVLIIKSQNQRLPGLSYKTVRSQN